MSENNQYDFILNPEKPNKAPVDLKANPKMMIGFIAFSLIVILVAFVGISTLVSSGSSSQKQNFVDMRLQQAEIIRVSELSADKESASDITKNIALNVKLTTLSGEQATATMLAKRGQKKVDPKLLATSTNAKTDALLEDAARQNKFNETYRKKLKDLLSTYQVSVKKAYDSGSNIEKQELQLIYDNNVSLIESIK